MGSEVGTGVVLFCDLGGGSGDEGGPDLAAVVSENRGEVADTNGRGVVAVFRTVDDAIAATDGMSRAVEGESGMYLKVGLAYGDHVRLDGRIIGAAAFEAARLHTLADGGEVLVTEGVRSRLPSSACSFFGDHHLQGFDQPVPVWRVVDRAPSDAEPSPGTSTVLTFDIVGSTALLRRIGDRAMAQLYQEIDDLFATALPPGMRLIDRRGDNAVLVAPSCAVALDAANSLRTTVGRYGLHREAVAAFDARYTVASADLALGEVAELAEALQSKAEANQILVNTQVTEIVRDRPELGFTPTDDPGVHLVDYATDTLRLQLPVPLRRQDESFAGRDDELTFLLDRWRSTLHGESTITFVTGDAGLGKTRLIAEFAAEAAAGRSRVLFGTCDPDWQAPFGPFAQALDLSGLATGDDDDRSQFFGAVRSQVEELANERPLVLVLDDLHWATPATVALLRHLVLDRIQARLFIVGAFRAAEIVAGHPMADFEVDVRLGGGTSSHLALDTLSSEAVADLVAGVFADATDAERSQLTQVVFQNSAGSPFFAQALIDHYRSVGVSVDESGGEGVDERVGAPAVPAMHDIVAHRVAGLGTDTNEALVQAATIGPRFSLDVLAGVRRVDPMEALDVIEPATRAGLLVEGERARYFEFGHALVRSTLLDAMSSTRKALLHERIARTLEDLPGDHLDELMYHWQRAGDVGREPTISYLRRAAERDARALDWEAAASRHRSVLALVDDVPENDEARAETWLALGDALRALGDADFLEAVKSAGRLARRRQRYDLLGRAALGSMKPGTWFTTADVTDQTIVGFCEDAIAGMPVTEPDRVKLLAALATSITFENDRDLRQKLVDEATVTARSLGDPDLVAAALVAEHLALWDPSTFDRRGQIAEELSALAARRDDAELEFLGGFFRASWLLEQMDVDGALRQLDALEAPIARAGHFWFQFLVERMRIGLGIARGEPGMRAAVDSLFERGAESQADAAGTWAAHLGGLAIHDGTFGNLAGSLKAASERNSGQGIWSYAYVNALVAGGDLDAANQVADTLVTPNVDFMWMVSMQMWAEVGYSLERPEVCRVVFEALEPYAGRLGVIASGTLTYDLVSNSLARTCLSLGHHERAAHYAQRAMVEAERHGFDHFGRQAAVLLAAADQGRPGAFSG